MAQLTHKKRIAANHPTDGFTPAGAAQTRNLKDFGVFESTSYGPPWNAMQGTGITSTGIDLRDGKPHYVVAVDPHVIPLRTYLTIEPNPFGKGTVFYAGDTGGAIKGNRIDFYDWRGRPYQNGWGRRNVKVVQSASNTFNQATGAKDLFDKGVSAVGGAVDDGLNALTGGAGDAISAIGDLVKILTSPQEAAALLAKIAAYFLRLYVQAMWKYVISPPWHWTQRAVVYYFDKVMSGDAGSGYYYSMAGIATMGYWALGYGTLWAKADDQGIGLAADPRQTLLGSSLRRAKIGVSRRSLTKPEDVEDKTPDKPDAHASEIPVERTRTVAATRKRAVRVTSEGEDTNGDTGRRAAGRRSGSAEAPANAAKAEPLTDG